MAVGGGGVSETCYRCDATAERCRLLLLVHKCTCCALCTHLVDDLADPA